MAKRSETEAALITSIIKLKSLKEALNSKITEKFFFGSDNKTAFRWILDYRRKYGGVPSKKVFLDENKTFNWTFTADPTGYWIEKVKERKKKAILKEVGEEFWEELQEDKIEDAFDTLQQGVQKINVEVIAANDKDWTKEAVERAREIKARRHKQVIGIPTPWPEFDKLFMGWQDDQLITVHARPGIGKTWEVCHYAYKAWEGNYKPLIISKEMGIPEIERRIDALHTGLGHENLRTGLLTKAQRIHLFKKARALANNRPPFIISAEEDLAASGVANISAKVEEYKPDILIIDGVYLLDDDLDARTKTEKLYNITKSLKRLAKVNHIPVIVTTQTGRGGGGVKSGRGLEALQWSDSFGQDSDVVIGLAQTSTMRAEKKMLHRVDKQREGLTGELYTKWDLSRMDFGSYNISDGEVDEIEKEAEEEAQSLV